MNTEQAQEAWKEYIMIRFIRERDDARQLLNDYKAACASELEKRFTGSELHELLKKELLSLLDTVKPL